jgi:hypothetical protein
MGIIKQGITGGFSGMVGNVIGGSWKGIAYMRIRPVSVANPKTEPQLDQRSRFAIALRFLEPLTEFLHTGFRNYAIKMSAFNSAMSYNVLHSLQGTYPNYTINYPNALIARGKLPRPQNQVATSTVAGTILFTWDDNSDEMKASVDDKSLLVVYNPVKDQAVTIQGLAERADGTQTITVPDSFSGDQVHCYIAFMAKTGTLISNSGYAGAVTVA